MVRIPAAFAALCLVSASVFAQVCATTADCADLDGDAIRDDPCVYWACEQEACVATDIVYADSNTGPEGDCGPDGVVDINEVGYGTLSCFSSTNEYGSGPNPCEALAPQAMNIDYGSRYTACVPDGVCDVNDSFIAQLKFAGLLPCTCPLDGAAALPARSGGRSVRGTAEPPQVRVFMAVDGEQAMAEPSGNTMVTMQPGSTLHLALWLKPGSASAEGLQAYQLILEDQATPLGVSTGTVSYVDIAPGNPGGNSFQVNTGREDWVFADGIVSLPHWFTEAPHLGSCGVLYKYFSEHTVVPAADSFHYFAEFDVVASPDASGVFELRWVRDPTPGLPRPLTDLFGPDGIEYPVDEFQDLLIGVGAQPCTSVADCADTDGNLIRDDSCVYWECLQQQCAGTDIVYGDGNHLPYGACGPDGVVDINDSSYGALSCFANIDEQTGGPHPCEENAPQSLNIDAGGRYVSCVPDGVCDINDSYIKELKFAGLLPCTCPLDEEAPQPGHRGRAASGAAGPPEVRVFMAAEADLAQVSGSGNTLVAMAPGSTLRIGMWFEDTGRQGQALQGYQLMIEDQAAPLGPSTGSVRYLDTNPGAPWGGGDSIFIDRKRPDWIFADGIVALSPWYTEAPQLGTCGTLYKYIGDLTIDPTAGSVQYLAEFDLVASPDASGVFELRWVREPDPGMPRPLSDLFGSQGHGSEFVVDEFQDLLVFIGVQPCASAADCADADGDAVRDDVCTWWACSAGICAGTSVNFGDMGGQFGACQPDGAADGNDRFHALNCFANTGTDGAIPYPCESAAPAATNVDVAGLGAPCAADGVCDLNDAFAALNAFDGTTGCSCGGAGAAPGVVAELEPAREVRLELVAQRPRVEPGDIVHVDVFIAGDVPDLRGYQIHAAASPGLRLADLFVAPRGDHVFAGHAYWSAYNLHTRQMLAGLDGPGVAAEGRRAYLTTLAYEVTAERGELVVDLLSDAGDPGQRTVLLATPEGHRVRVAEVRPAAIRVTSPRRAR